MFHRAHQLTFILLHKAKTFSGFGRSWRAQGYFVLQSTIFEWNFGTESIKIIRHFRNLFNWKLHHFLNCTPSNNTEETRH